MEYLFAYQPTVAFDARIDEFGELVCEWEDERLYELTVESLDDEFNDWIRTQTCETELIGRVRGLDNYDDPEERLSFSDLWSWAEGAHVIERENPGGDIRKYLNSLYGGVDTSIDCSLFRSTEPRITGFEPLSMGSVEEFVDIGYCEAGMHSSSRYPSAERVLEWTDRVHETFDDVECGALGGVHIESDGITAGVNGFVVYDAYEEVRSWAEKRWLVEEPEEPFMRPNEFSLYQMGETPFGFGSVLRMWWD